MAGLPKAVFVLISMIGILTVVALAGVAQDLPIDPVILPPEEVQTDSVILQPVFDLIDSNLYADLMDQETLKAMFDSAITLELLSPEQALSMLELVDWATLVEPEASAIIQSILSDLLAGTLTDGDPLLALTRLLNELATPAGTLTAIGKAGASDEVLDQVSSLAAAGIPPGILVQITKKALRDGLSMDEVLAQLDALVAAMAEDEDASWGQLSHNITGEGEYQDQEQNENIEGNEEPEEEANIHGNASAGSSSKDRKDKKDK